MYTNNVPKCVCVPFFKDIFVLLRVLVTSILHQKKDKDLSLDIVKIDIPSAPNCSSPIPFWDVSKYFSL